MQMYMEERKNRDAELAAARQQKLESMEKLDATPKADESNHYPEYNSSFESFTESHSIPKIINHRTGQQSYHAEDDDIIEEIIETEPEKPIIPPKKSKREKSSIRQLLESAVEVIPMAVKKATPPVLATSKPSSSLSAKDADFSFKMVIHMR
jgi:Golgi nucleoside diphosphatase